MKRVHVAVEKSISVAACNYLAIKKALLGGYIECQN